MLNGINASVVVHSSTRQTIIGLYQNELIRYADLSRSNSPFAHLSQEKCSVSTSACSSKNPRQ
jgi:hypothetical protein